MTPLALAVRALASLPARWLVAMAGGAPITVDGRTLDPLFQALFARDPGPPLDARDPAGARRRYAGILATFDPPAPAAEIRDHDVPVAGGTIRLRVVTPASLPPGPAPAVVYLHGGGHVIGDVANYTPTARWLAARLGAHVLAVDYRLAPEHHFPTAVDDAVAAWRWVHDHAAELGVDPARTGLLGDSAGGNLAAVVALLARDRGLPAPVVQALVYPVTDLRLVHASLDRLAEGFGLTRDFIATCADHYVPNAADRTDPRASPLLAASHAGLAPAIVTVAGFDPLRDDGLAYAQALRAAGVPVDLVLHDALPHGWFTLAGPVPPARAALDDLCARLASALRAPRPA